MPCDRISQSGTEHHELMLTLALRSAACPSDSVVQPAQLALRARIHVPHACDYAVGLVVQVKAIRNQLVKVDLRRAHPIAVPVTIAISVPITRTSRPPSF